MMRELVIERIKYLKEVDGGFNPKTMRWSSGSKRHPSDRFSVKGVHFSAVDWDNPELTDADLLNALTRIVSRSAAQM